MEIMLTLKEQLEHFVLSAESREKIKSYDKEYLKTLSDENSEGKYEKLADKFKEFTAPKEFEEIAKTVLAGYFLVTFEDNKVKVRPTCVEFYYHEEVGDIKDYIVYHRNPINGDPKDVFDVGTLHNHVSGIDITFESGNMLQNAVRASMLIREFKVDGETEAETRSTKLYDALYQYSVFSGFSVKWVDGKEPAVLDEPHERKNVALYKQDEKSKAPQKMKAPDDMLKDSRPKNIAEYVRKPLDLRTFDNVFVQDPRRWQFRIKDDGNGQGC